MNYTASDCLTPAQIKPRSAFPWPLAGALVCFGFLFLLDFPKPMIDDLFYSGAALNLASGGDFSNPLLARQQFPNHFFFVYPPLHSYALAGWMKVFGISAASLLGFQGTMYLIIAGSAILILRLHAARTSLQWLAPLGVTAVFLSTGLRPEAFAVALTMAGYALFTCGRENNATVLVSFLLIFLGASAAPRTAPFAGAMAALATWRLLKNPPVKLNRLRICALAGAALAVTVLIFLVCIGFRFSAFRETFHLHATRLSIGKGFLFSVFLNDTLGSKRWPLLALTIAMVAFSARFPANGLSRLAYVLAGTFPVTALIGGLGHGTGWFLVLALFAATASVLRNCTRQLAGILLTVLTVTMLAANATCLTSVFGILTGKVSCEPGKNRGEVLALKSTGEHPLLVDASVARYTFGYKLPTGSIDWGFSSPFPGMYVTDTDLHDGDVFAVSAAGIEFLNQRTYLNYSTDELAKWEPFRWFKWAHYRDFQNPREAFVIPVADCKGIRPEYKRPRSESGPSK